MRRLVVERPIAAASASRLTALFALYVAVISLGLLRFGLVEFWPGIAALASGIALAVLALLLAVAAFVTIWRTASPGGGRAFAGFVLAAILVLPPLILGLKAAESPPITDVTTDLDNPPVFTVAASERGPGANPLAYDKSLAARQREAYPKIYPLISETPPDEVRRLILDLVREHRWRLVVDMPLASPASEGRVPVRRPVGRIEAVDKSLIFGFEDDIVIRLSEQDGRTRVDMRSAARYGPFDFGVNADRVASFLDEVRTRAMVPAQAQATTE
jgi:hypothetical protein